MKNQQILNRLASLKLRKFSFNGKKFSFKDENAFLEGQQFFIKSLTINDA